MRGDGARKLVLAPSPFRRNRYFSHELPSRNKATVLSYLLLNVARHRSARKSYTQNLWTTKRACVSLLIWYQLI